MSRPTGTVSFGKETKGKRRLIITDDESEQLGSWTASPGKEVKMSGLTHFTTGTLSRLALVRTDDRTLLSYDVP